MSGLFGVVAQALWVLVRAIAFVLKIFATYFFKCFRDVVGQVHDEWKNRELDDEIY